MKTSQICGVVDSTTPNEAAPTIPDAKSDVLESKRLRLGKRRERLSTLRVNADSVLEYAAMRKGRTVANEASVSPSVASASPVEP